MLIPNRTQKLRQYSYPINNTIRISVTITGYQYESWHFEYQKNIEIHVVFDFCKRVIYI
jgi:hypothetical protein